MYPTSESVVIIFCTIRHGDEATGSNYTIYLEHLGGFLPILKGKKTSKLKPEFVIFDPLKGRRILCSAKFEGGKPSKTFQSLNLSIQFNNMGKPDFPHMRYMYTSY